MKAHNHPIVIVRRKKMHAAHHGGAWKVAYADFVTAMMAFFLVMWLSAQDSRIRDAVAGYFAEPGLMPNERSNSVLASGRGGIDSSGMPVIQRRPATSLEAELRSLVQAEGRIKDSLTKTSGVAALRDQVEMTVNAEGLRVELVERPGSSFFDSGRSVLRGESVRILSIIASEIGKLNNDVVIEGHTDSVKYSQGQTYGNWELSADRANAARRVMALGGLHDGQLRTVRGFADTDLRIKDSPLDPRNRRVSIVVKSQVAAQVEAAVRNGLDTAGKGETSR